MAALPRSGGHPGRGAGAPGNMPQPGCANLGRSGPILETQFDPERTPAEIQRVFGHLRDATYTPMSLRSIFLAMAKAGQDATKEA